jgi:hypothetical protein
MRSDPTSEPRQQCDLARLEERVRPGICAHPDIQADCCADPSELIDRDVRVSASFDPTQLRRGNAARPSDRSLRAPKDVACDAELVADPQAVGVREAAAAVDRAFPGTHREQSGARCSPATYAAENGSFDSGTIETGATDEQTFADPGTYAYLCQIHPDMKGTIDVTATAPAAAALVEPSASAPPTAVEVDAQPAADTASLGGIALAVTLVSIASALFARVLRGTVRTPSA